jgi:hypothetical protein
MRKNLYKSLKRIVACLMVMIVIVTSFTYSAFAESEVYLTELTGKLINNADYNNYTSRSSPMTTFICENDDETFTRVQADKTHVLVETYDKNNTLKSTKSIGYELPIFGGFYEGSEYYFLVFGKKNPEENKANEVLRVVKYTKDWKRVCFVSICGANTTIPFASGSARMTETAGKLYLHTSHQMYKSTDGLNHQANMTFVIDQEKMVFVDYWCDIMNISYGYVSHSFNQFIQTDDTYVYRVDHGDAYPRSITLTKCAVDGRITNVNYTDVIPLNNTGEVGQNATGASIGGFELSSDNCIIAGNCVDYTVKNIGTDSVRNIFVSVTDKNLNSTSVKWITNYDEKDNVTVLTPQMVKINDNKFLIMWRERVPDGYYSAYSTHSVIVNEKGEMISKISSLEAVLSDCQPIYCKDGMIRWFVSTEETLDMYCVNENGSMGCLDGNHTYSDDVTVPSTCTQAGEIYERCTKCSLKRVVEKLELAPHDEAINKGYAATCTANGKTDGKYCKKCNFVIQQQETITSTGHKYGEVQVVKEPTYTEYGECKKVCGVCGYESWWQIDKLTSVMGDINKDGMVTAVDARIVLQIVAGLVENDSSKIQLADMNNDGVLTAVDARIILQKVAGL